MVDIYNLITIILVIIKNQSKMKGILTKEQEKFYAERIDDMIKAKGLLEIVDGPASKVIITSVDDSLLDRLPEAMKEDLSGLAQAGIDNDVELAEKMVTNVINGRIDIPGIDEETESLLFAGVVNIVVASMKYWVEHRKEE